MAGSLRRRLLCETQSLEPSAESRIMDPIFCRRTPILAFQCHFNSCYCSCSSVIVIALFGLCYSCDIERSSLCWVSLALRLAESLRGNKPGRIPSADEAVSGWVPAQAAAL